MSVWGDVRDRVLARTHELGRQVALALLEQLRRAVASDRRMVLLGRWPEIFAALGVPAPSGKAARAALVMLLEHGRGLVERITCQYWRVATHAGDLLRAEQLDLVFGGPDGPEGKGESAPGTPPAAPPAAAPAPTRARSRSPELERAFGRLPVDVAARLVAARVDELQAVERGQAWAVTITAKPGDDVERVAEVFAAGLERHGAGCWLVGEISPKGRLHFHGIAIGSEQQLLAAGAWCGGGESCVSQIRDLRRLRYWASYCRKAPATPERSAFASGVLAGGDDGIAERADAGRVGEPRDGGDVAGAPADAGVLGEVVGELGAPARRSDRGGARGARALRRLLEAARGWLARRLGR